MQTSLKSYIFQEVSASANQILLRCFSGQNWQFSNSPAAFGLLGSAEQQLLGGHWKAAFCFCTDFEAGPVPTSSANIETGLRTIFWLVF